MDCSDADAVSALIPVGEIVATGTLDVKLQESDVLGSGYTDITDAAITQLGDTDDNAAPSIDVNLGLRSNHKKYIRAVHVVANANVDSGVVLLLKKKLKPVTNTPATVVV